MAFKLNFEALKTPFAWVSYVMFFLVGGANLVYYFVPLDLGLTSDLVGFFRLISPPFFLAFLFVLFDFFSYFGLNRHSVAGLLLGLGIAGAFVFYDNTTTYFKPIEDYSINLRFRLTGEAIRFQKEKQGAVTRTLNPQAHPAIEIVGIDQATVNAYEGFPFSWDKYARFLASLEGSAVNTIMFDVFFLDEKNNNYGLLELSAEVQKEIYNAAYKGASKPITISTSRLRQAPALLSDQMLRNNNVVLDYSFETSEPPKGYLDDPKIKARYRELARYEIQNVIETPYNRQGEWVNHPEPPIARIGASSKGLGYANIVKEVAGTNRTIPLVTKWQNRIYPSIVLVMAARYFGIDVAKDVEVKLGSYVKLKNIPEKMVQHKLLADPVDIMKKPNKAREVTIPIDFAGFMHINFIGGNNTFPFHSFRYFADSERGTFSGAADGFKDKVLLVALYYATGVAKDIHASPYGDIMGIEHLAQALNTILSQDFILYASPLVNSILFLLFGLLLGLLAPRVKIVWILIGSFALLVFIAFEAIVVFDYLNYVHHFFTIYIEMAVILISITAYKVLSEEENVKYIRTTFSKFVAKDVVNELLAKPEALRLGGEKKEVTVFFSDIRGFTTLSESMDAEGLVALLNEYLSEMTDIIIHYKGTVDKYMGDAIMAFWGAPLPMEDHAYRACLAAKAQMNELKRLREAWRERNIPTIDIGIGLNSGDAVVGNMGSSHRMDYTTMGDTINLGSRLEGVNKIYGTHIIISETTYKMVKEKVYARELDLIRVKGKTQPVTIYELIDVCDENDFKLLATAVR